MDGHFPKSLPVRDILKRTRKSNSSQRIRDEYYSVVAQRYNTTVTSFMKPENQAKNRYSELLCWDHSRVVLDAEDGSDYIHANWIDGFEEPKKFIATQGPMENTTADFWKLVWQQRCHVIVMLTPTIVNGEEKCHQYWCPRKNGSLVADEYHIETLKVTARTNHIRTCIRITNDSLNKSRKLTHFQCNNWFETSTPFNFPWLVHFIELINNYRCTYMELSSEPEETSYCPIVVHCSTGIGRTGTFCAVDICLKQVEKTSKVSVLDAVSQVRKQRYEGVIGLMQYMFIYQAVEYFISEREGSDKVSKKLFFSCFKK
uniref:protein-tyrosine-phosphatase n=1 Tax=Glyptapanteles flavicoxis TaxID=463051 RepID=B7S8M8_9HYME|nr:protein tyrosine phosphatase [Glyptapanteles flavicoxis]